MYIHLTYYSGDRSLIENIGKMQHADITGDKVFFLGAVENDVDALRFRYNDGSHFDVIFLHEEQARSVYGEILAAVREKRGLIEMDIRSRQIAGHDADVDPAAG